MILGSFVKMIYGENLMQDGCTGEIWGWGEGRRAYVWEEFSPPWTQREFELLRRPYIFYSGVNRRLCSRQIIFPSLSHSQRPSHSFPLLFFNLPPAPPSPLALYLL